MNTRLLDLKNLLNGNAIFSLKNHLRSIESELKDFRKTDSEMTELVRWLTESREQASKLYSLMKAYKEIKDADESMEKYQQITRLIDAMYIAFCDWYEGSVLEPRIDYDEWRISVKANAVKAIQLARGQLHREIAKAQRDLKKMMKDAADEDNPKEQE